MKALALLACVSSIGLAAIAAAGCSSSSSSAGLGDDGGGAANEAGPGADGASDASVDQGGGGEGGSDAGGFDASTGLDAATTPDTSTAEASAGQDAAAADSGASLDAGVDANCGSIPSLHPDPAGTIYCGFGDAGAISCTTGTECCLGGSLGSGFAPEQCAPYGSTCTNGGDPDAGGSLAIPNACAQISDCTANGVTGAAACCLQGATAPSVNPGCTYPRPKGGTAVVCETGSTSPGTCAQGEVQVCSSQADCPAGTTCTPGKWKIYQLGFCL